MTDINNNEWKPILINGDKIIEVKTPKFVKGELTEISGLRPFEKTDENDKPIVPTVSDAQELKRSIFISFLKRTFKNYVVLSGAGSSMDVGGKSMVQLWELAEGKIGKKNFQKVIDHVKFDAKSKDLESLLSQIDGVLKFSGDFEFEFEPSYEKMKLSAVKTNVFELIKEKCSITKPTGNFPHKTLLEKLLQRKVTSPRLKIFTLNYDLLFEHAATDANAIIIDGFSFTIPRTFSGRFYDFDIVRREGSRLKEEDNFIERVFHLHKLHGSLNWKKHDSGIVSIEDNTENPLMIYPREAKYEDSYEQPFFEMMARFQRSLRKTDDTLLLCVGYSFNDKHINAAIEEALNQNPGFRLVVVDPNVYNEDVNETFKSIKLEAQKSSRIIMISETFSDFVNYYPEMKTYQTVNN